MAKSEAEKVASAFKTLLARAEEVKVNDIRITSGTGSCVGKWSMTLKSRVAKS